jgi:hypothetical protein
LNWKVQLSKRFNWHFCGWRVESMVIDGFFYSCCVIVFLFSVFFAGNLNWKSKKKIANQIIQWLTYK